MDYQVMECRYNYSPDDADILFATNNRREAIESANEFGANDDETAYTLNLLSSDNAGIIIEDFVLTALDAVLG